MGMPSAQEETFKEAYDKWRSVFKVITKKDIEDFEKTYKGSKEEIEDLIEAFELCEGDMQGVMESVPLCTLEDLDRFNVIIDALIKDGKFPEFAEQFYATKDDVCLAIDEEEAEEAEKMAAEMGLRGAQGSETALVELIRSKQNARQ